MRLPIQSRSFIREISGIQPDPLIQSARNKGIKPLGGGGGGGSDPPAGCWPSGTECRGVIQNMVYCCPGGTTWKREEGWCFGWYDAPPCKDGGGGGGK